MNTSEIETVLRRMLRGRNGVKLRYRVYMDTDIAYENTGDVCAGIEIPGHIKCGAFFVADASAKEIARELAKKCRDYLDEYVEEMCSQVLYQITDARLSHIDLRSWNRLAPWEDIVAIEALKGNNSDFEYINLRRRAEGFGYAGVADALSRAYRTMKGWK